MYIHINTLTKNNNILYYYYLFWGKILLVPKIDFPHDICRRKGVSTCKLRVKKIWEFLYI